MCGSRAPASYGAGARPTGWAPDHNQSSREPTATPFSASGLRLIHSFIHSFWPTNQHRIRFVLMELVGGARTYWSCVCLFICVCLFESQQKTNENGLMNLGASLTSRPSRLVSPDRDRISRANTTTARSYQSLGLFHS